MIVKARLYQSSKNKLKIELEQEIDKGQASEASH